MLDVTLRNAYFSAPRVCILVGSGRFMGVIWGFQTLRRAFGV